MSLRASVLQCLADAQDQSEAALATAEDLSRHPRASSSQTWKENPKCLSLQPPDDASSSSKKPPTAKTVKVAFFTSATEAELMLHSRQFDVLLKAGVPTHLRDQVWCLCSGAGELRRAAMESYPALLHRQHTFSKCAKMDIKKDLPQTFPLSLRNSMRQSQEPSTDGDPFGGLRRVLQAYSLCNPAVGY
ncbi:hypothetical protein PF003_g16383 [Phytophthora fragariae]|nr:hypothetical protein PF003_g16383 [Phytophthora fragariae]